MSAPAAITPAMLASWREHRDVCGDLGIAAATFKHRGRQGTETTNGVSGNTLWRHSPVTSALPATTDYSVWAFWMAQKVRGNQSDGGDTDAGRAYVPRMFAQMAAVATDGRTIVQVADDDWLLAPDGQMFKCENPVISPDGAFWTFEMVRER